MKEHQLNKRLSLVLLVFASTQILFGSGNGSDIGGLPGAPFRLGFAARGIGMGNAMTAVPFGNISSYYNPALVPYQVTPTVLLSYGSLSLDRRLNFASYSQHLNPDAGLSVGVINAGVGNLQGRDNDGLKTSTYSTSENQFFFSFGLQPDKKLSIGITAKLLYYSLFSDVKSTTLGLDIGTLYSISNNLTLGVVLQDVLSKYKWDTSKLYGLDGSAYEERFPLRKRIGLSYLVRDWQLILGGEIEWIGGAGFARLGTEVELFSGLQIRAGIDQMSFSGDVAPKPSLGFSVQTEVASWSPRIDYAYVIEPYVSTGMHYLTLTLSFR
jgi:hypothetical protein